MFKKNRKSKYLLNATIILIVIIATLILISSFFRIPVLNNIVFYNLMATKMIQRIIALLLFVIAWNLYLRKSTAYLLSLILLSVNLCLHLVFHHHRVFSLTAILEIIVLVILLTHRKQFQRPSDTPSVKRALIFSLIAIVLVFFNAAMINHWYTTELQTDYRFRDSLVDTGRVLIGLQDRAPLSNAFERTFLVLFWASVIAAILLLFKATIYRSRTTLQAREKARRLILQYGQNPAAYLTLEDDKTLFFGREVEGVIPYGIVEDVIVVNGDPVCRPEDFRILLAEFKAFCQEGAYQCIFLSVTDMFLEAYRDLGYHYVKCGEEARIDLPSYQLAGKRMQRLRGEYNYAAKRGFTTHEYDPRKAPDPQIEAEILAVSQDWMQDKKSSELSFTVGRIGLNEPLDKRYFYARDEHGKMIAIDVFVPFNGQNGYMADITRRIHDAPRGATEKLTFDAFCTFRDEGLALGSLGVSPLSGIMEDGIKENATSKLFSFVFEKGNGFYGFKDLRQAKQKMGPSSWEPCYYAFTSKNITARMAYAIVRIQNPRGLADYVKGFFKSRRK